MEVHTTHAKCSLGLDKMLWEKKVEFNGRERDLGLCEVALVEAQSRRADGGHRAPKAP
jgi:hypothetical protein